MAGAGNRRTSGGNAVATNGAARNRHTASVLLDIETARLRHYADATAAGVWIPAFYAAVSDGADIGAAQLALRYSRRFRHPFYPHSLLHIGDWKKIRKSKNAMHLCVIVMDAAIAVIAFRSRMSTKVERGACTLEDSGDSPRLLDVLKKCWHRRSCAQQTVSTRAPRPEESIDVFRGCIAEQPSPLFAERAAAKRGSRLIDPGPPETDAGNASRPV